MFISVIIPSYNPSLTILNQALESLKKQTVSYHFWELIIIDNNSSFNIADKIDLNWHPNSKVIIELQQGLLCTYKRFFRIKGRCYHNDR